MKLARRAPKNPAVRGDQIDFHAQAHAAKRARPGASAVASGSGRGGRRLAGPVEPGVAPAAFAGARVTVRWRVSSRAGTASRTLNTR